MGCLFGARLTAAADVILFGHWPEQITSLRQRPLRFIYPDGHEEPVNLRATDDLNEVGTVDVALVVTKSHKTAAAAEDVARVLAPDGVAITLQNGIGNREILESALGGDRVLQGITMQGASTDGRVGYLRYAGGGPTILAAHPAAPRLAALFEQVGLDVKIENDITALVWGKLAINAAINPLTALLRVPNGALLESEWARHLMGQAAQEVAAVAAALHITLPDTAARVELAARLTASNHSSMLQDVLRHTETEIEAICGAVVRLGETVGIPTPVNRMFYDLIKALETTYNHQQG